MRIEWSGPKGATFSIESAWEGIGDRNIMETEDSEETEFQSPLFGRVYLIYTPKGNGDSGVKKEILTNWVEDANMQAQPHDGGPIIGRAWPISRLHRNEDDRGRIRQRL